MFRIIRKWIEAFKIAWKEGCKNDPWWDQDYPELP